MLTTLLTALAGVGAAGVLALVWKGAKALGAGRKLGDLAQSAPDVETFTAGKGLGLQSLGVVGHYFELAMKHQLTGDKLDAAIDFASTNPSPTQALAYVEQNFGLGFLGDLEASIPAAAHEELTLLGDHVPTTIRDFVGKMFPAVVNAHAQQVLDSKEIQARLEVLTTAKAATAAEPAPLPKVG